MFLPPMQPPGIERRFRPTANPFRVTSSSPPCPLTNVFTARPHIEKSARLRSGLDLQMEGIPFDEEDGQPISRRSATKHNPVRSKQLSCSEMTDPLHAFHVNGLCSLLQQAI